MSTRSARTSASPYVRPAATSSSDCADDSRSPSTDNQYSVSPSPLTFPIVPEQCRPSPSRKRCGAKKGDFVPGPGNRREPRTAEDKWRIPAYYEPMWLRWWTASQASAYVQPHARSLTKHGDSSPGCNVGQDSATCSFQTWSGSQSTRDSIPS